MHSHGPDTRVSNTQKKVDLHETQNCKSTLVARKLHATSAGYHSLRADYATSGCFRIAIGSVSQFKIKSFGSALCIVSLVKAGGTKDGSSVRLESDASCQLRDHFRFNKGAFIPYLRGFEAIAFEIRLRILDVMYVPVAHGYQIFSKESPTLRTSVPLTRSRWGDRESNDLFGNIEVCIEYIEQAWPEPFLTSGSLGKGVLFHSPSRPTADDSNDFHANLVTRVSLTALPYAIPKFESHGSQHKERKIWAVWIGGSEMPSCGLNIPLPSLPTPLPGEIILSGGDSLGSLQLSRGEQDIRLCLLGKVGEKWLSYAEGKVKIPRGFWENEQPFAVSAKMLDNTKTIFGVVEMMFNQTVQLSFPRPNEVVRKKVEFATSEHHPSRLIDGCRCCPQLLHREELVATSSIPFETLGIWARSFKFSIDDLTDDLRNIQWRAKMGRKASIRGSLQDFLWTTSGGHPRLKILSNHAPLALFTLSQHRFLILVFRFGLQAGQVIIDLAKAFESALGQEAVHQVHGYFPMTLKNQGRDLDCHPLGFAGLQLALFQTSIPRNYLRHVAPDPFIDLHHSTATISLAQC